MQSIYRKSHDDTLSEQRTRAKPDCGEIGCTTGFAVNHCCFCEKALCMPHSHATISDEGYDAYACAYCAAEIEGGP